MSAWPAPSAPASLLLAPPPVPPPAPPATPPVPPKVAPPPERTSEQTTPERTTAGLVAWLIGRFAALAWCWLLIWSLLWSFGPTLVGWSPTVVSGGSMAPSLAIGDVVHIDSSIDLNRLGPGSVIAFDDPGLPEMRVMHRVTGVEYDDGRVVGFRTKGDANDNADSTIVPVENVHGVGRLVVPYAGLPKVWLSESRWLQLAAFGIVTIAAAVVAGDTVQQFVTGRPRRRRRKRVAAVGIAIAAMLGGPSSTAAFTGATNAPASTFTMTPQWFLDTIDRDGPIAHWRLGEVDPPPVTVFSDDFETFSGWTHFGTGSFVSSTAEARSGVRSGYKTESGNPSGAWKSLPTAVSGSVVLSAWVWRQAPANGAFDQVGLLNAVSNGYSVRVDHKANVIQIDRRTAGTPTAIGGATPFDPPEKVWFRIELVRTGSSMVASAYDGGGALLATTSATDATTNTFDRVVVYGGEKYHVDDMTVVQNAPTTVAVDRIGTLNGAYTGGPTLGAPALVLGQPDTAVDLDGINDAILVGDSPAINLAPRSQRTTELWFEADRTTGRQVLYEEGGTTDGLNVYLAGATLYATAWSVGWSNPLVTSTPVAVDTRYHVAVTLDAVGARRLTLYVNGAAVGAATKADGNLWNPHPDDGAIGYLNGGTRFHDGIASGTGSFPFDGAVDEVVLFNSVVSAAHIANHRAAGV